MPRQRVEFIADISQPVYDTLRCAVCEALIISQNQGEHERCANRRPDGKLMLRVVHHTINIVQFNDLPTYYCPDCEEESKGTTPHCHECGTSKRVPLPGQHEPRG